MLQYPNLVTHVDPLPQKEVSGLWDSDYPLSSLPLLSPAFQVKAWSCVNLIFSPRVGYSAQWLPTLNTELTSGVKVSCTYRNSMVLLPTFLPLTSTTLKNSSLDMSSSYTPSILQATWLSYWLMHATHVPHYSAPTQDRFLLYDTVHTS